jgi:hypothetical protein
MTQIPIIDGIYSDNDADFRTSYPVNMTPVPKAQGISNGYLRPADGIVSNGTGPGQNRGGINWKGFCYRVMGNMLVKIGADNTIFEIGSVGFGGQVSLDYSFDRLAIASGGRLYYWDESTLTQVTDADLGNVLTVIWVDGYFMTTDGEFLIVTELNDPTEVDPLKYGSSEVDPDPVKALLKIQDEVYALNRYTIEVFDNIGGTGFPFQRIEGAQINKGPLGTHSCCVLANAIAFLGSGRNEAPAIYLGKNSDAQKISTREIDQILLTYTEQQLSECVMETRIDSGHQHLWIRLPDRTLVYDLAASASLQRPVWFILTSSLEGFARYRAGDLVWCYNRWMVGDPSSAALGTLTDSISSQYGQTVRWEFGTTIVYNEGRGAIFHQLELVCLTGRTIFGEDPYITTAYSVDGVSWGQDKPVKVGMSGDRSKRIVWFQQGKMQNWRIQRFQGTSDAFISVARLEVQLEPLAY